MDMVLGVGRRLRMLFLNLAVSRGYQQTLPSEKLFQL